MKQNRVIKNIRIVTPQGSTALKGDDMGRLLHIENGIIVIVDGIIEYAGEEKDCPGELLASHVYEYTDGEGRVALPGIVDSHTHLVFGGYRPDEFSWRLKGSDAGCPAVHTLFTILYS